MILADFYQKFDIFWKDEEFGFLGDDLLICQIISSLQILPYFEDKKKKKDFACVNENESVLPLNVVSRGIFFIFNGHVDLYYKKSENITSSKLLTLAAGSYFGDISYIFNIRNQFIYKFNNFDMNAGKEKTPLDPPYILSI